MKEYAIGLYEKALPDFLPWEEKLKIAKEVGYDYLEMSIDASQKKIDRIYMSQEERKKLIMTMFDIGLPIRSMSVSALTKYALGDQDNDVRNKGLEIGLKAIELAADLGIRTVMIPGYDIYFGESTLDTKRLFLENMKILTAKAVKNGVLIGFETMENDFMNTVGKAMKYISLIESPYLKIYPDSGNITNAAVANKHDVCEDLKLGKNNLIALHLKETIPGHFREIPYGQGHVEFSRIIDTAWDLGVRRFVTEFWYVGQENWREEINDAFMKMTNILKQK